MTAYVEQLCRSKKRVNPIDRSLQIVRLLLANDKAACKGLASFLRFFSGVVLLHIFHAFFLTESVCYYGLDVSPVTRTDACNQRAASPPLRATPYGSQASQDTLGLTRIFRQ